VRVNNSHCLERAIRKRKRLRNIRDFGLAKPSASTISARAAIAKPTYPQIGDAYLAFEMGEAIVPRSTFYLIKFSWR